MFDKPELTDTEFRKLSDFIHETWGIKMPPVKKVMLEARLAKRLRVLNMTSFSEYVSYLFSTNGEENEVSHMIDVVSTNKTEFFREPDAYHYLMNTLLPAMISHGRNKAKRFTIWSSACSSGEEPYSLAMIFCEFAARNPTIPFDYIILGTDISGKVLEEARKAIYSHEKIEKIPVELRKKYFLVSKDRSKNLFRIVPKLRKKIRFHRMNLMEDFGISEKMDIVFCRNVIIYFERKTQENLLKRLCKQMVSGGYIFMGHSETLSGMDLPLVPVAPMIYRKTY